MNQRITLSRAISYMIGTIAILLILGVWPFGFIHRSHVSQSMPAEITESESATAEQMYAQVFVSEGTSLDSVDILICSDVSGKSLDFEILDGEFKSLYHKEFIADRYMRDDGYVHIPTRLSLERGTPYIYSVFGVDEGVTVGLESHNNTSNTALYPTNYAGMEDADHNIVTKMNFDIRFNVWQTIFADLLIVVIATILIWLVQILFGAVFPENTTKVRGIKISEISHSGVLGKLYGRFPNKIVSVHKVLRIILNPLIVIGAVIALYMVFPRCTFSDLPLNIVFWNISILMLAGLLLYVVNRRVTISEENRPFTLWLIIRPRLRGFITAVAIAEMIWYCFEYMNGLYDIFHYYSARRVLIWFLVMIITTYSRRELFSILNAIWAVVAIPIAYFYAKPYVGMQEEELLYKLNVWIIYIGGFVVINIIRTIIRLIRDRKKDENRIRFDLIYSIPFVIFILGMVILANTRWEPAYLAVMMALLIFRLATWDNRNRWLEYLCNGIIFNFIAMVVFSLLHRPYYGYIYHRYNMNYFTVTMTATHLTLVMAAVVTRLFVRSHKVSDKRQLIPDMMLFGAAASYMIFTLSRTGYAAFIVMLATGLIIEGLLYSDKRIKSIATYLVIMVISTAYMFPITFTATRMLPAMVDDPVIYDYEPCQVTIYKGTEPDNEYYMDIHRFVEVFNSKILDIGDAAANADRESLDIRRDEDIYVIDRDQYQLASAGDNDITLLQLASADEGDIEDIEEDEDRDESNGRMDIFRSYIEQSNLWGHDHMGAILADGEEASHAHNIYLQVIFDHGWIYGIFFALFMVFSWIYSIVILRRNDQTNVSDYGILIPILLTGFMVAGLVEWIFHPCNPYGLTVCMAMAAMIFGRKYKHE